MWSSVKLVLKKVKLSNTGHKVYRNSKTDRKVSVAQWNWSNSMWNLVKIVFK